MNTHATILAALGASLLLGLIVCSFQTATPTPIHQLRTEASWYGNELRGKLMANGHPFVPEHFTCASYDFPLGARLRVASPLTGRHVVVLVTDRGPSKRLIRQGRRLDLSIGAWTQLGLDPSLGVARVSISRLP